MIVLVTSCGLSTELLDHGFVFQQVILKKMGNEKKQTAVELN
jgi:hypothetical protein